MSSFWGHSAPVSELIGPIACGFFSRTDHPKNVTFDTALNSVLSNTPAECEVDWMNGGGENRRTNIHTYPLLQTYINRPTYSIYYTYIHTEIPCIIVRL